MKRVFAAALLGLVCLASTPVPAHADAGVAAKPRRIVLVGDSTIAPNGGWGPAFSRFLDEGITCTNVARAGRSSKSYLAEGLWDTARDAKGDYYLIQFGHNDQPGKGPDRETDPGTTYTSNMARMVADTRAIGAQPVLITSLTRRDFSKDDPTRIEDSLEPYADAVRSLAAEMNVPLIDLHSRSIALCERLGPKETGNLDPIRNGRPDTTHLNAEAGEVFARMVVEDLGRVVPALAPYLQLNPRAEKPRIFVLTDIENEPDDQQSMVRFLTYCNQWDVEGLVATTSIHQRSRVAPERIRQIIEAYGKVRENLEKHEPGYPTTEYLLERVTEGLPVYGKEGVGEGKDSPGSERLIQAMDADDPRPLWVTVWGGPNVLAQALWKLRETRPPEAVDRLISKLRVYTISDQDDTGPWLRNHFTNLFYICSPGFHAGGAYHYATWSGISGDTFWGRFVGADFSLVDNPWLDEHIRSKGPLGAEHPHTKYLMEGDTPSFLNLVNNGLSDPEHPDWGGWGGRYEFYQPHTRKWFLEPEARPFWSDTLDEVMGVDGKWHTSNHATIWRWRSAYQNDFAARIAWTVAESRADANHPPVPKLAHANRLLARPGDRINLSAAGTADPDGDALSYEWFFYNEAGTLTMATARTGQPLQIENHDQPQASFEVPTRRVMPPGSGSMHLVLAVTDNGAPPLTRYQRVIVHVTP